MPIIDRLMKVNYSASRSNGVYVTIESTLPPSELNEWLDYVDAAVKPVSGWPEGALPEQGVQGPADPEN